MLRWELAVACVVFAAQARADPSWRAGLDVHGTDAALGGRRPFEIELKTDVGGGASHTPDEVAATSPASRRPRVR